MLVESRLEWKNQLEQVTSYKRTHTSTHVCTRPVTRRAVIFIGLSYTTNMHTQSNRFSRSSFGGNDCDDVDDGDCVNFADDKLARCIYTDRERERVTKH